MYDLLKMKFDCEKLFIKIQYLILHPRFLMIHVSEGRYFERNGTAKKEEKLH